MDENDSNTQSRHSKKDASEYRTPHRTADNHNPSITIRNFIKILTLQDKDLTYLTGDDTSKKSEQLQTLQQIFDNARTAFDLGAGIGNSTNVLFELCPHLETAYTVDAIKPTNIFPAEDYPHIHHVLSFIGDFLSHPPKPADVILLAYVPDHQLSNQAEINQLSSSLTNQGLVIETGDTNLNHELMKKHFDLIFSKKAYLDSTQIWIKKPPSDQTPTRQPHTN